MSKKRRITFFEKFIICFLLMNFFVLGAPVFSIGTTGVFSGTILDKNTGKPVDNVIVTAKGSSETYTAATNANGFFSIAGMNAGDYDVSMQRVGYETADYSGVTISSDATTNLQFQLASQPVEVSGITVKSYRSALVNPRQTMTNYGYSGKDFAALLPPVGPNLTYFNIYETLPGVQISYDAYYGADAPHIRGGTGSDVGYAFDGVPTYETITNTFGTNLVNMNIERADFYTGSYPPQYGNFLSGYVNEVVPRGSGAPHGSIAYSYGFWTDNSTGNPTYQSNGLNPSYSHQNLPYANDVNLELSGKDRRFSYYLNQIIQDGYTVPFGAGIDIKPYVIENGGFNNFAQNRDSVFNLTYALNDIDELQFLYYTGIQKAGFEGFQELPCNPSDANIGANYAAGCLGTSTQTGFGETFNANNISQLNNMNQIASYSLSKLELTHRFPNHPGSVLNVRLWDFSPTVYFQYFDLPTNLWEFRHAQESGILVEHQNQLSPQHLLDIGGSFLYAKNYLQSSKRDILAPNSSIDTYFNAAQQVIFNSATPGANLNIVKVPDTQTWSAWVSDEWRPTPKWDIFAGLRYDRQNYLELTGDGISTAANGLPFVSKGNCPGTLVGLCADPTRMDPSQLSPRIGVSYQLSNKLTMKASYGRFLTFAPARRVDAVQLKTGGSAQSNGTISGSGTVLAAFQNSGSKTQRGENIDVSWEYQLNDNVYAKLTPYIKHIGDPLESIVVLGAPTFTNAGTIESKGIEFYLKSHDWHNLSGQLSYTYSSTKGSQIPFETAISGSLVGAPGSPFTTASILADNAQVVPMGYDERHMLNLSLNYKIGKFEIAPSFFYGSGLPYGLGAQNLRALAAVQNPNSVIYGGATAVPADSSAINPLHETTFNSLRGPAWWLGNLAISYHFTPDVTSTLSIFNVFNSSQIIGHDTQTTTVSGSYVGYVENSVLTSGSYCCYNSADGSQLIMPQYDPTKGQYAPSGYPNLRSYFLTVKYNFH